LLAAGTLSPAQARELITYRDGLNPAALAREIADIQAVLLGLAKDKTEQLYLATVPKALPDVRKGVRIKAG
ncbi:MAG TPA: integrase, partial [Microlunatus sp.]|nr:integrase [Microlunatus sp.]